MLKFKRVLLVFVTGKLSWVIIRYQYYYNGAIYQVCLIHHDTKLLHLNKKNHRLPVSEGS